MVIELFSVESAKAILAIPIPYRLRQDQLIWVLDPKGIFLIKSVQNVSFKSPISANLQSSHWKKLWRSKLPKRLRIGVGALPTKVNLNRRFDHIDPTCIFCNNAEESPIHLFFGCPFTKALWASACWGLCIKTSSLVTDEDIIKLILIPPNSPLPSHDQWTISLNMALIIDEIWRTRNLV
ncbi:uncharacterized protein LOC126708086 [Quercus robur]|uniref:uncharacterized protein LOC126708086 n=1 Tax=Quercus robur TaxID=38942 RepID=UPI002163B507|nr:uncharacterized protein LOC126708086 [Quercus robur]